MHPFGGVDEQLVPEINAHVNHPFRLATPGAVPEEQQVALLERGRPPELYSCCAGWGMVGRGVVGEPAEVRNRGLECLIVEAAAEAFIASGLSDFESNDLADGAQLAQAWIQGAVGRVIRPGEVRQGAGGGEEHRVSHPAGLANQSAQTDARENERVVALADHVFVPLENDRVEGRAGCNQSPAV